MRKFDALCLTPIQKMTPKIRVLRDREGASQTVFAAYLNVTPSLVSKWERGEKHPRGGTIPRLRMVVSHHPSRPQFPRLVRRRTDGTLSSLISGHLQFVTADIHAAPSSRAFLALIEEVKDTRLAFANTRRLIFCKQVGRSINYRRPKICRLARLEHRFPDELRVAYIERRTTRVFTQE